MGSGSETEKSPKEGWYEDSNCLKHLQAESSSCIPQLILPVDCIIVKIVLIVSSERIICMFNNQCFLRRQGYPVVLA